MAEKKLVICDTNILVRLFRNAGETIQRLRHIGAENLAISVITKAELILGASKKNLSRTEEVLDSFQTLPINVNTSIIFNSLVEQSATKWNKTIIADLLIASTAMAFKTQLLTYNIKDFEQIEGLNLISLK